MPEREPSSSGPISIDRTSPVPLYFQLAQHFESAIRSGALKVGARLENEVADGPGELERARLQATIASLTGDLARTREQVSVSGPQLQHGAVADQVAAAWAERDRQLAEVKQSTTWRVGRAVLAPLQPIRRLLRRTPA